MKTRAPQDPPEDTPEALRARSFALIAEAEVPRSVVGLVDDERTRALILAGVYASLAQTAPRAVTAPQEWSFPAEETARVVQRMHATTPHPSGAEQHPEDDGVDYTLGDPPPPIPAEEPRELVMDHRYIPDRINLKGGLEVCVSCDRDRFDHVTEEDQDGNEVPVHVAVPRAVLTGLARVVEWAIQGQHYTLDGLTAQPDVQAAIRWMRSNA